MDLHYHYINQTSAITADWCFFNSNYNRDSFIDGVEKYLKKMPDHKNLFTLNTIKDKSSVLHLGCELSKNDSIDGEAYNFGPSADQNFSVEDLNQNFEDGNVEAKYRAAPIEYGLLDQIMVVDEENLWLILEILGVAVLVRMIPVIKVFIF